MAHNERSEKAVFGTDFFPHLTHPGVCQDKLLDALHPPALKSAKTDFLSPGELVFPVFLDSTFLSLSFLDHLKHRDFRQSCKQVGRF